MANSRAFLRRRQTMKDNSSPQIDYGAVTLLAYKLYEQRGRVDGCDQADWFRAEDIIRQRTRLSKN